MTVTLAACPACGGLLEIRSYECCSCGTEVRGHFSGCVFCGMSDEDRYFCLVFLQCEGNMKDVEQVMGISYPTIKNRLSRIGKFLEGKESVLESGGHRGPVKAVLGNRAAFRKKGQEILAALERGEMGFTEAMEKLESGLSGHDHISGKKGEDNE